MTKLVTTFAPPADHIATLYDNLEHSIKQYPNVRHASRLITASAFVQIPYLGIRELLADGKRGQYKWQTYAEAADARSALGSGLLYHGIAPGSTVGLYSVNRPEWCLLDAACHAYSLVTVPLYDTLGPDSVEFICNHAELAAVCCSVECLPTLAKCLDKCPTVKLVVCGQCMFLPTPPMSWFSTPCTRWCMACVRRSGCLLSSLATSPPWWSRLRSSWWWAGSTPAHTCPLARMRSPPSATRAAPPACPR